MTGLGLFTGFIGHLAYRTVLPAERTARGLVVSVSCEIHGGPAKVRPTFIFDGNI